MNASNTSFSRLVIQCLLLCCLFSGLYSAYQWYQNRYLRPFSEQYVLFDGAQLQLPAALAGAGSVRLLHIWDPSCPCNVGNQQHLGELLSQFADDVDFYVLQKPNSHGQLPSQLASLTPLTSLSGSENIPSSPAVAVWDRQGNLAYFGPYSEGAVCTSENSFIEPILRAVLDNKPVQATHQLASGCFCDWSNRQP